jgi:hypothetical protein
MEKEKQLTEQESLQIIRSMIEAAKNDVKADAFVFLLWGWLVFIASISQFLIVFMDLAVNQSLPWLLMPLGGIITPIYVAIKRKKDKTRTPITESLKYIWIAFTVALLIVIFFNNMSYGQVLPVLMCFYGVGLFLSGSTLKFKPLIMGGIFCWISAIVGFYVQSVYLLLVLAICVLGGYIIPGYMLKMNNKK